MAFGYILFVAEDNKNSEKAIPLVQDTDQICVISSLTKPAGVEGVPTLLDLQTNKYYLGTDCLMYMRERNKKNLLKENETDSPTTPTSRVPEVIDDTAQISEVIHFVDEVD